MKLPSLFADGGERVKLGVRDLQRAAIRNVNVSGSKAGFTKLSMLSILTYT